MTDTELLNWLESKEGFGLISDDNGHWAVSGDGIQNCPTGKKAQDIATTFLVFKKDWKKNIREALKAGMKENP